MNIFLYTIIGIIGALFGSFFTLAVYRLPRKEDITHERSYCPKCKHKLGFWDLIPILSYIFLGGKCRYCKEPIHPRYILFELFTSAIFILLALSLNISIYSNIYKYILFSYSILFIAICMITGLLSKEGNDSNILVIVLGYVIRTIYLVIMNSTKLIIVLIPTVMYLIFASLIMYYIYRKKDAKNVLVNVLFIGLVIYQLGTLRVIVILIITLICLLIRKYAFKLKNVVVYYISSFTILIFILNNTSYVKDIFSRWIL